MTRRVFTSPVDIVRSVGGVARAARPLAAVLSGRRLDARERELVIVAVSREPTRAGAARPSISVGRSAPGLPDVELQALELGELCALPRRSRTAVVYATALAEGRFRRPVAADIAQAAACDLTPRAIAAVEALARAMNLVNLSVNTAEALLERAGGLRVT